MQTTVCDPTITQRALEWLRRAGNPFRNYFARNPDDEVCALFHVPDLFATQRKQLYAVVDLFRSKPTSHSEMVPVLGNKGAGKTHLLHSIKHGEEGQGQLLVTPGVYQKGADFLEYLLFQVIDTLLGGGKQKGKRPLEFISEDLTRRLLIRSLQRSSTEDQLELFPAPGLGRWTRRLGLGTSQAQERTQWLLSTLSQPHEPGSIAPLQRLCAECAVESDRLCNFIAQVIDRDEARDTAGLMLRHIYHGFTRVALLGEETELANFLTYGFAELEFHVRPSRQELVLSLFKVMMGVFQDLNVPVVVAFDQLEDLLLARRSDDGHRVAEAFFAGIVQAMHQLDGICFLIFAERGLWNRFIPSLDGYIQDRLNNPVHLPEYGTVKALRLEAPSPELVYRVVQKRMRPALREFSHANDLPELFPFNEGQVSQVAKTEPTLRDMLQQFRHLFDHVVFGETPPTLYETPVDGETAPTASANGSDIHRQSSSELRINPENVPPQVKSVVVVETSADQTNPAASDVQLAESWDHEMSHSKNKLLPDGALTGATRELQAGLGMFLHTCHEHGVKVGPWRLQHVVPEWSFGDHPTYGIITIAHWVCKDGQPWKVGIGLFLGKGPGKPRDLETKLGSLEITPPTIDHLILLRPEDDLSLTGKSKSLWKESERRGRNARIEAVSLDSFSVLYGFSRWLTSVNESLPNGQPVPNLADLIQDKCDQFLEQVCMPICP